MTTTKPPEDKRKVMTEQEAKEYIDKCSKQVNQTTYFQDRGLTPETINKFKLGYDPGTRQVILPVTETYYIKRSTERKQYINMPGREVEIFNLEALKQPQPVFITEGIIDALSILQSGYPAISLNSTSNADKFIEIVNEMTNPPELLIYMDQDDTGKAAEIKLIKGINKARRSVKTPGIYKDANEYLKASPERFNGFLSKSSENDETSISYHLTQITGNKELGFFIPTGFTKLDQALDGGLYEGLIVLGAIPSIGKTTFALVMAMQMAEAGHQVYFYSLEQSARELTLKLLSNKTDYSIAECRRIARDQSYEELRIGQYYKAADELHKLTGLHFIEDKRSAKAIHDDIKNRYYITGKKAMIIIDYLQILDKPAQGLTDKQAVDQNITALKRISADLQCPVLAISNLNRDGYDKDITMTAFKESGGIEYSTDILLGMQWTALENKDNDPIDHDKQKKNNPREIQIKILKNRNGKSGDLINFEYDPEKNQITEEEGRPESQRRQKN